MYCPARLRGRSLGAPCSSTPSRNSYRLATRDPGVAHPDVELALVFLVGVLRELCALSSHPPCVVGFRSHQLAFCCQHPRSIMLCLSWSASVRSATQCELFLVFF